MAVHNHGPAEGRGLDCGERRMPDGTLRGWCLDGYTAERGSTPSDAGMSSTTCSEETP